jgi:glucosamine--fructose-6-phosphate aminotransferase (isomerizing)
MIMIAAILGKNKRMIDETSEYISSFPINSRKIESQLSHFVDINPSYKSICVLATGKQYGVAIEGAYINIEMAQFPSHYYSTLEFRHGPIVMIDEKCLTFILCRSKPDHFELSLIEEIKKMGGKTIIISSEDSAPPADLTFAYGSNALPEIIALFGVFILQGLAYFKSVQKGLNPDKPKELVQWIKI